MKFFSKVKIGDRFQWLSHPSHLTIFTVVGFGENGWAKMEGGGRTHYMELTKRGHPTVHHKPVYDRVA